MNRQSSNAKYGYPVYERAIYRHDLFPFLLGYWMDSIRGGSGEVVECDGIKFGSISY